jgi:prepilin-type N-terminal cleavage/methylation domain-containing protein
MYFIGGKNVFMLKPYTQNLNRQIMNEAGFTLLELMITLVAGLLVMVIGFSAMHTVRGAFLDDLGRISSNQNTRGALDIIGIATREAGENLDAFFPAILLEDDQDNSKLTIRRNLLDEVLKLCTQIDQGSNNTELYFAIPGTEQGCIRSDQLHNFTAWGSYRMNATKDIRGYIYDASSKQGEFFTYTGETDTGDSLFLQAAPHVWQHEYSATSTAIYLLEEWVFQMNEDVLQIIQNGKTENPLNVADNFDEFKAEVILQDGTSVTEFTPEDKWTTIQGVRVSIANNPVLTAKNKSSYRSKVSAQFFPRNILSH